MVSTCLCLELFVEFAFGDPLNLNPAMCMFQFSGVCKCNCNCRDLVKPFVDVHFTITLYQTGE